MAEFSVAFLSGAQFDALPYEEGRRSELVSGDLIPVSSANPQDQDIVANLLATLRPYLRRQQCGCALPDVEFALSEDDRLRPDVAVLLQDRWRTLGRTENPIPGSPNIAVEVISPSQGSADSARKVWTYLGHGVEEVWQVLPESRSVLIHTALAEPRVIGGERALESVLLPGWTITLKELFQLSF